MDDFLAATRAALKNLPKIGRDGRIADPSELKQMEKNIKEKPFSI